MAKTDRVYVIGIDEAGYGPNLGPLVIGASMWNVPQELELDPFASQLEPQFQAKRFLGKESAPFIPLGDSKELYQSGGSTDALEIGVLSLFQNAQNASVVGSDELWTALLEQANCLKLQPSEHRQSLPWYEHITQVPAWLWWPKRTALTALAASGLKKLDVRFEGFQARIVDEIVFNQGLKSYGGKGKLLSLVSLNLVLDIVGRLDLRGIDGIEVYCDRHGGRSKYLELLQSVFGDIFFWIEKEASNESCYRTEWQGCPLRIRFTVGGDRFPPTSAASMLAKWLREVSMGHFNAYWQSKVPGLKSTAGYPVDAKRFVQDLKRADLWQKSEVVPSLESIWRQA